MSSLSAIIAIAVIAVFAVGFFYFGGLGPLIAFILASAIYSDEHDDDQAHT